MDIDSEKVIDFELVQVSETGSSVKVEAVGFKHCFSRVLDDHKLNVDKFASDRHVSIRKIMKDNYKDVKHNFDVFHSAKNISSKLRKIAKKKDNEDIECWIKSINNHVWWCSRNCEKDPSMLVEMWMSLIHHIAGKHSFHDDNRFTLFKECRHPAIDPSTNRLKKWLVEGSSAHQALVKVVLNKLLLNDMKHLAEFMHTGALEVFHNVVLKYAPKRLEFDFPYMSARLKLAALDHNYNVGRAQAVVQQPSASSSQKGELQYKKSFSKIQKQWVLKPVYEKENYNYVFDMMAGVVKRKHNKQIDPIELAPAQNIAPLPAPTKEEMLATHSSRF
ncbi:hypothetical protein HOLleu_03421 [Holothuria leucospilota]|uniref:Uncharacterized protein n=1 Tax=Holothuria leucospilota TaxID=206669 RepID=A0A9Q1HLU1_HOLLE|nr:hypothetical protein HOLleu_03421 [Holothuria leucospilota]